MKVVCINSVPRSGSSWLTSIFESHPNIKTIFQPLFSYKYKNFLSENSDKQDFEKFIELISDTKDEFCLMKSPIHKFDAPKYDKDNIDIILMKHVRYHNLLEKFIEFSPDIKIILLIRNPYAVIHSQLSCAKERDEDWLYSKHKNDNQPYNFFGFQKWKEFVDLSLSLRKNYPNNVIIVKYETLVESSANEVQKLCKFVGIDFHENMNETIKDLKSKNDVDDYSVYKQAPLVERWVDELDPEIVKIIDQNIPTGSVYSSFL